MEWQDLVETRNSVSPRDDSRPVVPNGWPAWRRNREIGFQPCDFGFRLGLRESRTMRSIGLVAPAESCRDWKSDVRITINRCFTTTRKPCQLRRSGRSSFLLWKPSSSTRLVKSSSLIIFGSRNSLLDIGNNPKRDRWYSVRAPHKTASEKGTVPGGFARGSKTFSGTSFVEPTANNDRSGRPEKSSIVVSRNNRPS